MEPSTEAKLTVYFDEPFWVGVFEELDGKRLSVCKVVFGAEPTDCVKSTCYNMTKAGYTVHVISDCVTSYDLKKMKEMLAYYASKGCEVKTLDEAIGQTTDK